MEQMTATTVDTISSLKFPSEDVISLASEKRARLTKLFFATKLGNLQQGIIRIYFADDKGPKMVETTIWATGDKNVILKRGTTIPIHRILDVLFQ
jgi:hypothetical protein